MSKDQWIGLALIIGSIAGITMYAWLVYIWTLIVLMITAFLVIAAGLGIVGWIGFTLVTTPAPQPIGEIEKELSKEKVEESKAQ